MTNNDESTYDLFQKKINEMAFDYWKLKKTENENKTLLLNKRNAIWVLIFEWIYPERMNGACVLLEAGKADKAVYKTEKRLHNLSEGLYNALLKYENIGGKSNDEGNDSYRLKKIVSERFVDILNDNIDKFLKDYDYEANNNFKAYLATSLSYLATKYNYKEAKARGEKLVVDEKKQGDEKYTVEGRAISLDSQVKGEEGDNLSLTEVIADDDFDTEYLAEKNIVTADIMNTLATIMSFVRKKAGTDERKNNKLRYYKTFFTDSVVCYSKEIMADNQTEDLNEREIIKNVDFDFGDYYVDDFCRTIGQYRRGRLKTYGELVNYEGRGVEDDVVEIPVENNVIASYLKNAYEDLRNRNVVNMLYEQRKKYNAIAKEKLKNRNII